MKDKTLSDHSSPVTRTSTQIKARVVSTKRPSPRPKKRAGLHPVFLTLPAALLELIAAGIVLPHASSVENMDALVYGIAVFLCLFFTWLFHHAALAKRWGLQVLVLIPLLPFMAAFSFFVWELYEPHRFWHGGMFLTSEINVRFAVAAVLIVLAGILFPVYMVLFATLKTTQHIQEFAHKHLHHDDEEYGE